MLEVFIAAFYSWWAASGAQIKSVLFLTSIWRGSKVLYVCLSCQKKVVLCYITAWRDFSNLPSQQLHLLTPLLSTLNKSSSKAYTALFSHLHCGTVLLLILLNHKYKIGVNIFIWIVSFCVKSLALEKLFSDTPQQTEYWVKAESQRKPIYITCFQSTEYIFHWQIANSVSLSLFEFPSDPL